MSVCTFLGGGFSFDPQKHDYRLGTRVVPACTSLLATGGLVQFKFVDQDVLERKSNLGKQVHLACHLHNLNKLGHYDPLVKPRLHAWIEFKDNCKSFKLISSELQMVASVNGMNYGMQIDVNATVDGFDTVIELKIGKLQRHHGVQLAGYAAGLPHPRFTTGLPRFLARKRIGIELKQNGHAHVERYEDRSDFDVFSSLLHVSTWKQKYDREYQEEF